MRARVIVAAASEVYPGGGEREGEERERGVGGQRRVVGKTESGAKTDKGRGVGRRWLYLLHS